MALKTDYQNDVLDTSINTERTYNLVDENGNIIYEGVRIRETTALSKTGDNYGALEINETNGIINGLDNDVEQINVNLSGKVDTVDFNKLPVSPNSNAFKNDNGISVVNLGNNGYRDVTARQYFLRGGDHIRCDSNIAITNIAANEYRSLAISDILFSGSASGWGLIQKALSHVLSSTSVSFTNCTMNSQQIASITKSGNLTHIHAIFTPNVQINAGTTLYTIPTDYLTRISGYQTWGNGAYAMDGTNTFKRISLNMANGYLYSDGVLHAGVEYSLDISVYNAISY